MAKVFITRLDGGKSVMTTVSGAVQDAVDKWKLAHPGEYVSHEEVTQGQVDSFYNAKKAEAPTSEEKKAARKSSIAALTITKGSQEFDACETSVERIGRQVAYMESEGIDSTPWTLSDGSRESVNLNTFKQVWTRAVEQINDLWPID